jgi:hypothetical protein
VYDHGVVLPLPVVALRIAETDGRQLIEAQSPHAGLVEGREYTFVLALPGAVTYFSARIEHCSGRTLGIALPEELHQAGFRDSIRTPLEASAAATVCFAHPRLGGPITRRLLDLSARGFAFESDPEIDLLFPGDRLARIQIVFADKAYEGAGTIRGIAPHRGSNLHSCGVEFVEFADVEQERHWRQRVFEHAHPRAVIVEPSVGARRAWRVLEASGYVEAWTRNQDRDRLAAAYSQSWSNVNRHAGQLMLVENRGETVGTLAGSVLYPKTWLVHQLGVDKRERQGLGTFLSLAHELYSGLMYLFQNETAVDYFVIYAERDRRWTQTLYADFVAQYPDRSAFIYDENRVFRSIVAPPVSRRRARWSDVEVRAADSRLLAEVSGVLRLNTSALEYNAMAYAPTEIGLEQFTDRCRAMGYDRGRQVLVASDADGPAAALIAETGSEGVNVFGLLNRCVIVNLRASVTPSVKATLLDEATQYFRGLEKSEFVFLDDRDADIAEVELLGYEFVSEGMRFIASKRVVPAWLAYLQNALSLRVGSEGNRG